LDWAAPMPVLLLVDMAQKKGMVVEFVLAQLQTTQLVGKSLHCIVSVGIPRRLQEATYRLKSETLLLQQNGWLSFRTGLSKPCRNVHRAASHRPL
jgi:hypothetical protein